MLSARNTVNIHVKHSNVIRYDHSSSLAPAPPPLDSAAKSRDDEAAFRLLDGCGIKFGFDASFQGESLGGAD